LNARRNRPGVISDSRSWVGSLFHSFQFQTLSIMRKGSQNSNSRSRDPFTTQFELIMHFW